MCYRLSAMWKSDFAKALGLILAASLVGVAAFAGCYNNMSTSSFTIMRPADRSVNFSDSLKVAPRDAVGAGQSTTTRLDLADFFCYSLVVWTGLGAADIIPYTLPARFFTGLESLFGILAFVFCVALASRMRDDKPRKGQRGNRSSTGSK